MENKQSLSSPAGERENIMGTMDINPLLIKLSVPMMVSMLVQALYNVVDSIFVSHVSESALTAVSLAFSLQNVMIAVGVGTGVGVNALLSKSLGEKNQERANKTAENGIFLSLCSYAVFLVIGLTCMKPYFYAQTSDMDIARQGIQYLRLCCVLSLGLFTQTMGEKLLAATGRTHLSMIRETVVRNGNLRAEFFRNIWMVEKVRKKFDDYEIDLFSKVYQDGKADGEFDIDDVNLVADITHYCIKGLEVPFIYGRIGHGLTEEASKPLVAKVVYGALGKKLNN